MKKYFPSLKIITLNDNISASAPLCDCDFDLIPKCSCDFYINPLRRCDCNPNCTCDSFKHCLCDLKPICYCDLDVCMTYCTCHTKKSKCYSDFLVPIESALPLGCQVDGVTGSKLVRISKTTISKGDVSSEVLYKNRETLEAIEREEKID